MMPKWCFQVLELFRGNSFSYHVSYFPFYRKPAFPPRKKRKMNKELCENRILKKHVWRLFLN